MSSRHLGPARPPLSELKAKAVRRFNDLAGAMLRTVDKAARLGETLIALKERMPHGTWERWVEAEFGRTPQWARLLMKLARDWPRLKPAFAADPRLTVSGALKLLRLSGPKTHGYMYRGVATK
jgi:hypothetical protein